MSRRKPHGAQHQLCSPQPHFPISLPVINDAFPLGSRDGHAGDPAPPPPSPALSAQRPGLAHQHTQHLASLPRQLALLFGSAILASPGTGHEGGGEYPSEGKGSRFHF